MFQIKKSWLIFLKCLNGGSRSFRTHTSFGAHNNSRLQKFLDSFGFKYEFLSATELYQSGKFDRALLDVLDNYENIINIILPTLGEDRRATYSPFLPICPDTRKVLQVPLTGHDKEAGEISYIDPLTGSERVTKVTEDVANYSGKLIGQCDGMHWVWTMKYRERI